MQIESDTTTPGTAYSAPVAVTKPDETGSASSEKTVEQYLFGKDGLTFFDLLDVINPLQHIPIISTFYRNWSGDEIGSASRVAGGALFGGPIGAAVAAVNAVLQESTGNDLGGHAVASLEDLGVFGDGKDGAPEAQFATASGPGEDHGPVSGKRKGQEEGVSAWAVAAIAEFQEAGRQADLAAGGAQTARRAAPVASAALQAVDQKPMALTPRELAYRATDSDGGWASAAIADFREAGRLADGAARTAAMGGREHADAGAVAIEGGWFSSVMLTALASYRDADKLITADAGANPVTMGN